MVVQLPNEIYVFLQGARLERVSEVIRYTRFEIVDVGSIVSRSGGFASAPVPPEAVSPEFFRALVRPPVSEVFGRNNRPILTHVPQQFYRELQSMYSGQNGDPTLVLATVTSIEGVIGDYHAALREESNVRRSLPISVSLNPSQAIVGHR